MAQHIDTNENEILPSEKENEKRRILIVNDEPEYAGAGHKSERACLLILQLSARAFRGWAFSNQRHS